MLFGPHRMPWAWTSSGPIPGGTTEVSAGLHRQFDKVCWAGWSEFKFRGIMECRSPMRLFMVGKLSRASWDPRWGEGSSEEEATELCKFACKGFRD